MNSFEDPTKGLPEDAENTKTPEMINYEREIKTYETEIKADEKLLLKRVEINFDSIFLDEKSFASTVHGGVLKSIENQTSQDSERDPTIPSVRLLVQNLKGKLKDEYPEPKIKDEIDASNKIYEKLADISKTTTKLFEVNNKQEIFRLGTILLESYNFLDSSLKNIIGNKQAVRKNVVKIANEFKDSFSEEISKTHDTLERKQDPAINNWQQLALVRLRSTAISYSDAVEIKELQLRRSEENTYYSNLEGIKRMKSLMERYITKRTGETL